MTNKEFKPGDWVYELSTISGIKLTKLSTYDDWTYPVIGVVGDYTANGKEFSSADGIPSLLHATPENRQALVTLYGEDVVPKLPLRGSELTKKLLEKQKYVLCFCSDTNDDDCRDNKKLSIITYFKEGYFYDREVVSPFSSTWKCAVPVDMNGNEITEIE